MDHSLLSGSRVFHNEVTCHSQRVRADNACLIQYSDRAAHETISAGPSTWWLKVTGELLHTSQQHASQSWAVSVSKKLCQAQRRIDQTGCFSFREDGLTGTSR